MLFCDTFEEFYSNSEALYESLSPKFNHEQVFMAGEGTGRSGSFFFFSHDKRFLIKTLTSSELKLLLEILPELSSHHKNHPESLLSKFLGVFTVKSRTLGAVHIVLMENTMRIRDQ
jgi:hypothetical protein